MKTIQTNRNNLFYGKYKYKVPIAMAGSRHLTYSRTYDEFEKRLSNIGYAIEVNYGGSKYRKLFDFYKKYMDNKEVTFLRDYGFLGFYTSNEDILNELMVLNLGLKVYEAVTPPTKVLYFAREPQYKYRVYLKAKRVSEPLIDSLIGFCDTYKDKGINISSGLIRFMDSKHWKKRFYSYLNSSFFIDFNDDSMITIMHLMMSECIGKTFKLERRPES